MAFFITIYSYYWESLILYIFFSLFSTTYLTLLITKVLYTPQFFRNYTVNKVLCCCFDKVHKKQCHNLSQTFGFQTTSPQSNLHLFVLLPLQSKRDDWPGPLSSSLSRPQTSSDMLGLGKTVYLSLHIMA